MKNFLRFLSLYRPYKWNVISGILLSLITVFAGICLLAVSGWFIAAMGIAGAASLSMNYFTPAAMIRGLAILRTSGRYGERIANHDAALRVTSEFREWFYNRLEPLAPAGLSDLHSADIFSRLRGDIDVLERFYLNGIVPISTAVFGFLILGVVLTVYYPPLALLELSLLMLAGFIVPIFMRKKARDDEDAIGQSKIRLNIGLAEMMQGMGEYLVYGRIDEKIGQIAQYDIEISDARKAINRRECIVQSIILLLSGLGIIGSIYFVVPLVSNGVVRPAELAMAALFCLACFDIVVPLPLALQSLQAARMASQRIFDIADRPILNIFNALHNQEKAQNSDIVLSVEHVSFSYAEVPVLTDVSFVLHSGEVMVLTGRSGVGKTTMLEILLGFRQATQGSIIFTGMKANSNDDESSRCYFSMVPQKPYYFADTLRANLMLANLDATDADIKEVCTVAGLKDVIDRMPEGLETYLGEHGVRLSGGQLRRVAIARALLRDAPILLLDEPSEGLDNELENEVMRSVLSFAKKRGQAVILCLHEAQKAWLPEDSVIINL